jgi:hypothetical protein
LSGLASASPFSFGSMSIDPLVYPASAASLRNWTPSPCRSPQGVICGLWLRLDEIDEAHRIAQDLDTPEGSFWHAIVHRCEPDPGNSAYWFRRTGRHPVFPTLVAQVNRLLATHSGTGFTLRHEWDPFAWIDFWERARREPNSAAWRLALEIQRVEWEVLFDYCAKPIE